MHRLGLAVAVLALTACSPRIPDSNPESGVGFGDYTEYRNYRNAADTPSVETTVIPPNATDATRATDTPLAADPQITGTTPLSALKPGIVDVKPVPVPTRTSDDAPSIVEFALATRHAVGTRMYSRSRIGSGAARVERNCAAYSSAELAQEAFLKAGGPDTDKLKLDPDGDGYACAWDPSPFRSISG